MVNIVNKGLRLRIFPDNDMIKVLEQNMGNARFVWNNILNMYNDLYVLFRSHNYPLNPSISNLNAILKIIIKSLQILHLIQCWVEVLKRVP